MINRFLRLVCGFAIFTVSGADCSRLVDFLFGRGVRVFALRPVDNHTLSFCVTSADYNRAKEEISAFVKRQNFEVKASEKGLYYLLKRYRMRLGMVLGIVCGIFLMFLSTFFVWGVTIETNIETIGDLELRHMLKEHGVCPGALTNNITERSVAMSFQLKHPEFVFVSFHASGTRLTAELMARTFPPEKQEDTNTCHLVAALGGIIESVEVQNGEPMVKKGDVVNAGDLLVSGAITLRAGGYRLVESRGVITAKTYREFECFLPFDEVKVTPSGRDKTAVCLQILGCDITLPQALKSPFARTSTVEQIYPLQIFGRDLPILVKHVTHTELCESVTATDISRAKEVCMDRYYAWLFSVLGKEGDVLSEEIVLTESDSGVALRAEVNCVENIAAQQEFVFQSLTQENN